MVRETLQAYRPAPLMVGLPPPVLGGTPVHNSTRISAATATKALAATTAPVVAGSLLTFTLVQRGRGVCG